MNRAMTRIIMTAAILSVSEQQLLRAAAGTGDCDGNGDGNGDGDGDGIGNGN